MSALRIRPWQRDDAAGFRAAVDETLPDLKRWMNWAQDEPGTLAETEARLDEAARDFSAGVRWRYAVTDAETGAIVGGVSLHPRIGPGGREIGFWVRASERGNGVASAAVVAAMRVAFEDHLADRVEIHCDSQNERSAAVALRLGFRLAETDMRPRPDGEVGEYSIYRLGRNQFPTPQILALVELPPTTVDAG